MADFDIHEVFNFDANLIENIIWQYDNAEKLKSLILSKNEWYSENLNAFWGTIVSDFLNIQTATDWGLNLWGNILQVSRTYNVNGVITTLSTELYRRLILGKMQLIRSNGTVPEINKYLNFIFSTHATTTSFAATVRDNLDMSVVYVLNFEPTDEELALIYSRTFLPTPAGVEDKIYLLDQKKIFGFYDTGFQPWGQAPFWDGRYI
jgi:hypothetical protein